MISCPTVQKDVIRSHYNLTTLFYRLLWGRHIHHGLWDEHSNAALELSDYEKTSAIAQQKLTETLAEFIDVQPDESLLDVGCGMGGSSIHLAKTFGCQVTGITLSPVQKRWASLESRWRGQRHNTQFLCQDAETAEFPPESFDVIWSIECTEHLFDKQAFFHKAASWLRPGGRMVICAWLAGDQLESEDAIQQVYDVCEGFFCPSLGSAEDYQSWMENGGLEFQEYHNWTNRVSQTWEICQQRVQKTGVRWLARLIDRDTVMFLDRFETILKAYETGAMQYGCFIARKPL
ncbi:Demethylrebeccamycin-D-glucose O-methyltransferase [Gimesia alba]|uniref:Demethylrebeccamycin-D-glucose O-methyltransferase n=1 Tax=Gimesia alba TaxID=2527973 RepID=A0A517RDE9_9PLAN|nr:class I SAM-dependent methyltransferase [Gimesia alba]QDT41899.1 Demethylrebeccamycin-D-glucose O-methyltransferase [Gimesia alba]